jgi:S-adenosylmethionine:tRNA ribosyltransferase-isomerase
VNQPLAAAAAADILWTGELDYALPHDAIAQHPSDRREDARLMVVDRASVGFEHARVADIASHLPSGALLVANDSRVIPARLLGAKEGSGGRVEALLLGASEGCRATAMVRAAKPLRLGQTVLFGGDVRALVVSLPTGGRAVLDFSPNEPMEVLRRVGEIPLPPYIERASGLDERDRERYQTVYARADGSVAAPTAGLHFSDELLAGLRRGGFGFTTITLHVGPGTFTPVRGGLDEHAMEEERYEIPAEAVHAIEAARRDGRPVVAVGTTTVRALEAAAAGGEGRLPVGGGATSLFIRPGFRFQVVDALLTNFHLPGSTLLALVMALAGRERIRGAYAEAIREGYRFYSFGDAMLIR